MAIDMRSASKSSIEKAVGYKFLISCMALSILAVREGRDSSGSLEMDRSEL